MDRWVRCLSVMLLLLATVFAAGSAAAQDVRRYIYAAVPGVSNDEQFGGVGVLVFDADNGHKFVRRIATWETYRREAIEPIKGIAAHAGTGRLYVSTTRRLAAFDLATDKIVWQKGYDADCCDRMAVSADGKTLYVPAFERPKWYVVDAGNGNVITTIVTEGEAHNTIYSPHSGRIYLASLRTPTMAVADSRTNQVVKRIGPFSNQTRPFAINARRRWSTSTSTICSASQSRIFRPARFSTKFPRPPSSRESPGGTARSATASRSPMTRKKSGLPTGLTTMRTSSTRRLRRLSTRKAFDFAASRAG